MLLLECFIGGPWRRWCPAHGASWACVSIIPLGREGTTSFGVVRAQGHTRVHRLSDAACA